MSKVHKVAIFSDVHFDHHDVRAWAAFRQWHREHKPALTIGVGDLIDLEALSRYEPNEGDTPHVVDQIIMAKDEMNSLNKECGELKLMPGNHEERWTAALVKNKASALRGVVGLSLEEQYRAQGLDENIRWVSESTKVPGVFVGKRAILVRHGHKQARGFGVANVSAALLRKFPGLSTIVGHHHRAQFQCQTVLERTHFAIANPHLSGDHDYAGFAPNWQRGFTILEFYGRSRLRECTTFTPHVIVMDDNRKFSYGGKIYG